MLAVLLLFMGVMALGFVFLWDLRRVTFTEAHTEAELRDSAMHLTYRVPEGQDPAVLSAALTRAGFRSVGVLHEGVEQLLVECARPADRARVREVIEHVTRTGFEGAEMHVAHVRFDDEPEGPAA